MIRLLLVTHFFPAHGGGVEIVAGELARRLSTRDVSITWAASDVDAAPTDAGLQLLPIPAWNGLERRYGVPFPVWGPRGLLRVFRAAGAADVVHLHDSLYLGNVVAYLGARWRGKPVLVTQHIGLVPYRSRVLRWALSAAYRSVGRMVLGGSTQVVFLSDKVQDYFAGLVRLRRPAAMIRNGVDRQLFFPVDGPCREQIRQRLGYAADRPTMLFVGRFVEKKGLPVLRRLAGHFRQCDWWFIGRGPDEPARWNLPNVRQIESLPHTELADHYRAADLLVLPSVGEGFPLVVQEALSCGLPTVISSDTAEGCRDVRAVAWSTEPDSEHLVPLLTEILSQSEELAARRERSAEFAALHWDWQRTADDYLHLIRELVAQHAAERETAKL